MKRGFSATLLIEGQNLGAELIKVTAKSLRLLLEDGRIVYMERNLFDVWRIHPELNFVCEDLNTGVVRTMWLRQSQNERVTLRCIGQPSQNKLSKKITASGGISSWQLECQTALLIL